MSRRRVVTILGTAVLVALAAAGPATARTKTVLAGAPPPKSLTPPGLSFNRDLDLNAFYPGRITINTGDSVRWVFSRRVLHTTTFLAPGQARTPLEAPDPAHPYTGFNDASGTPFWFNGQPSIAVPPEHALPQGGGSTDGSAYRNSGVSPVRQFRPYTLRFTRPGTFSYICLVHPGMEGTVRVLPRGRSVPSAARDRAAAAAQMTRAVARARRLARFTPAGNGFVAGHDSGGIAWFRFFPQRRTVPVGTSVRFSIDSPSEIHTAMFGPAAYRDAQERQLVMAQPQPGGPPRFQFNPLIFLPSDPPTAPLPPYTGQNHGNGYLNTGPLDTDPSSPLPPNATVTFAARGTFRFECTIHPGMEATVRVR